MFLPDPREAVIVKRVLTPKQSGLWYPGNKAVLEYNQKLIEIADKERKKGTNYVMAQQVQQVFDQMAEPKMEKAKKAEIASDEFIREQTYTTARTITLDTKFEGAVNVEVWTGYAVLVIGKSGTRKVIVGPQTYMLEYDENLAVIELSTGKPKTDDNPIKTVYLRVLHNKVSDIVKVETKDLCPADITLSYRVNFTGDPEKWFDVENYVKFLTDHLRSKIRNAVKKIPLMEFYSSGIDILRNIILGKPDENGKRSGGTFEENGMQIYDAEILGLQLMDDEIEELLFSAQHDEVKQKLELATKQNNYKFTKESEEIARNTAVEESETVKQKIDLEREEVEKNLMLKLANLDAEINTRQKQLDAKLASQNTLTKINNEELGRNKTEKEMLLGIEQQLLTQRIESMKAEVEAVVAKAEAVSPDLIAALQAFGDKALAEKMAQSMAPLSILGGESVAEVFSNMLRGTVLENVLSKAISPTKGKK
jgi:major vault protein